MEGPTRPGIGLTGARATGVCEGGGDRQRGGAPRTPGAGRSRLGSENFSLD